ncbi:MAG: tRNA (N(6)-L-threonylcarbamoyladenosine(37)-C(2))-methylthiotransferase MtaB [Eubacterium sp.]|nr:tRNA (N(6)-L-threonylcarbamoyladenosine(37)-C(2))-methylthiotransferase MtaB [Eubacterium sp.]
MSENINVYQPAVAFLTLGCKVNSYDSEAMMEIFEGAGYQVVDFADFADVYVINTCTVTHLGDRKSRQMMRKARRRNPEAIIVATGCYAQVAPEEVMAIEEVDLILGTQKRRQILDFIEAHRQDQSRSNFVSDIMAGRDYEDLTITENKGKTRAFLKVQEGCNRFCTYCIIPYARGPIRSRAIASVVQEVKRLVDNGFKEMVLTGIHIASYGVDMAEDVDLMDLIAAVDGVPGVERIRLGSLEPLLLTEDFVKRLAAIPSLCPHFHLSLQSGCDTVLARMGRRYTTDQYAEIVDRVRRYFDRPAITTDIMVGFPGETEAEFQTTLDFVKKIGFYQVHAFKYSRRKGTKAADFPDQVDEQIKNQRAQALAQAALACETAFLKANDGTVAEVLFERHHKDGFYEGHTRNYIPVILKTDEKIDGKILKIGVLYNKSELHMTGKLE